MARSSRAEGTRRRELALPGNGPNERSGKGALRLGEAMAFGVAWLLAASACGPSFQAIYEGNARFEHCYALEENAQVAMSEKTACWRDWSERYTYGQTRDRIYYATARYVALSETATAPTDEALMMAAPGQTPRVSTITAPTPTNAFAPPPKVLDPESVPSATVTENTASVPILGLDAGAPEASSLPGAVCADNCSSTFRTCDRDCDVSSAGKRAKSCETCQRAYRTCMRGCFR